MTLVKASAAEGVKTLVPFDRIPVITPKPVEMRARPREISDMKINPPC
jgi:hypothetical protein